MKCLLLCVLSLFFNISKCNLTVQMNHNDDTSYPKNAEVKNTKSKSVSENRTVYLEDVLFSIKNQNWSDEEQPCLDETLRLIHSLQNFTLWAVWDWDSISSEPTGLLFGNRYQLGNFDECLKAPWLSSYPELKTQYCIAEIQLKSSDGHAKQKYSNIKDYDPYQSAVGFVQHHSLHGRSLNELTWGICVPAVCQARSVERLLRTALARSHLGTAGLQAEIQVAEECQTTEFGREYDWQFYAFICFASLLVSTSLICTYLNNRRTNLDGRHESKRQKIIQAFCLKENTKKLTKVNEDGIEVLYGIRYLTMCCIVADHQLGMFNSGPIINGLEVDTDVMSPLAALILHDDLFVDTFFLMSGLLTASAFRTFKKLPNPVLMIWKRYVRLAVGYALVIFYLCSIYPYTGSGPLWPRSVAGETEPCRKNWWLSLLMLGNYIDTEHICIAISWYIPCDFHFFVIAATLYWMYCRFSRFTLCCVVLLSVAAFLIPGYIIYTSGLPPVQLFTYEFVFNPRANLQFHVTYIKSHTRFASYIVGFFVGYFYVYLRSSGKSLRLKWSVTGTLAGILIMAVTMLTGSLFLWRNYSPIEGAVYAVLNRPVWAFGVALVTLSCALGHVPLIKSFLSWSPFVPLSRLVYGLYLTHGIIITRNVFSARNSSYNDLLLSASTATGTIVLGTLAAYIMWLVAEAPVNNLLGLCLMPRALPKTGQPEEINEEISNSNYENNKNETKYNKRLKENLPSVISISKI